MRVYDPKRGDMMRILLVDDEPIVLRALQRVLKHHAVTAVTSGTEALALIRQGATFDLIACDLNMPDMSGRALYETLDALLPELARRMVFTTGGAFVLDDQAFLTKHPTLSKPFRASELETLATWLASP